jgi:simple sugar transport system permease protein
VRTRSSIEGVVRPLISVLLALVVSSVIMMLTHYSPLIVFSSLISGAFGNLPNFGSTLVDFIPLAVMGVGLAFCFQSGLFNIGAEGQYWVGAFAATLVGVHFASLPLVIHVAFALLAGTVAGAAVAAVPGVLKAYRGAHEVITTMMLSYAAIEFGHYLVESGPLSQPGSIPQSYPFANSASLQPIIPTTQLSAAIFVALAAIVFGAWLLYRTRLGLGIQILGKNPKAARVAGLSVPVLTILGLSISGAFAGLAGGLQMVGVTHQLFDGFSDQFGFTAIVVALLARNNPWAVVPSAMLFAALYSGAQAMQITAGIPVELSFVIQGLIVFFVAADRLLDAAVRGKWLQRPQGPKPVKPALEAKEVG